MRKAFPHSERNWWLKRLADVAKVERNPEMRWMETRPRPSCETCADRGRVFHQRGPIYLEVVCRVEGCTAAKAWVWCSGPRGMRFGHTRPLTRIPTKTRMRYDGELGFWCLRKFTILGQRPTSSLPQAA